MKKIGVLGTGTMGAGIIQVLAQSGYEVVMRARREASIEKGMATVTKNLDKMVAKEKITAEEKETILGRITGSTDIHIIADWAEGKLTFQPSHMKGIIFAHNTNSLYLTYIFINLYKT